MAMQFVLAFGDFVFSDKEEGLVVGGPGDFIDALEFFGQQLASAKIFDLQRVLPIASRVGGVSEEVVVIAGQGDCHAEKLMTFGKSVEVEEDLLRRLEAALFSAMDRVVLPLLGPRLIQKVSATHGSGGIGFFQVAEDFAVEMVAEVLQRFGDGVGVSVLGFEI